MIPLILLAQIGMYVVMGISIIAALGAILLPNLFHAAICFVAVLTGIAGVFILLKAEFLAVIQILIYVGAVMTLVIFAIMMTSRFSDKSVEQHNKMGFPVLVTGVTFFVILMKLALNTPWKVQSETVSSHLSTLELGVALMQTYVFPFEVVGVLLTAALIGAIVITRKEQQTQD